MRLPRIIPLTSVILSLLAPLDAVFAAWGPDPVQISAATEPKPQLAACTDGADGAIVAWQEGGGGIVRAHHILASGDVDVTWPAGGRVACSVADARPYLEAVSDGAGGAYIAWLENLSSTAFDSADLYVTRVGADGQIATGWPARGRLVGSIGYTLPDVAEDGSGGIYIVWPEFSSANVDWFQIRALHLGPDNQPAGGWSGGPVSVSGLQTSMTEDLWPQVVRASDGGAFIAWCQTASPAGTQRLMGIAPNGDPAPGWSQGGIAFAAFGDQIMGVPVRDPLIGMARSTGGDLFVFSGSRLDYGGNELRLRRLQEDGNPAPGWAAAGQLVVTDTFEPFGALDVLSDGLDGAILGYFALSLHVTQYDYWSFPAAGQISQFASVYGWSRNATIPTGTGNVYAAGMNPSRYSQYDPWPFLSFLQLATPPGFQNYRESHQEIVQSYYGDVAIVPATGGAIFLWTQHRVRFGVFAMRFNGAGQVVDVPAAAFPASSAGFRFVPGVGVRAEGVMPREMNGTVDLFDLAGRRLASTTFRAGRSFAVTLPGTLHLGAGVYFARIQAEDVHRTGCVVVMK